MKRENTHQVNEMQVFTPEALFKLFEKTDNKIDRLEARMEESRQRIEESRIQFEADMKAQAEATNKQIAEIVLSTDKQIAEIVSSTDKQIATTNKQIARTEAMFADNWGRLVEALVKGDLVRLLNERDIMITHVHQRMSGCVGGRNFEYDLIAVNGDTIVVVEVKTTLRVKDVGHFARQLKTARIYLPEYSEKRVIGAMAYLHCVEESDLMAENRGMFVIRATGNSASIVNKEDFQPRCF